MTKIFYKKQRVMLELSDRIFFIFVLSFSTWLTRWKKGEKKFRVKLTDDSAGSVICRVPKPILEILGKPSGIKFVIQGKKIIVVAGDKK